MERRPDLIPERQGAHPTPTSLARVRGRHSARLADSGSAPLTVPLLSRDSTRDLLLPASSVSSVTVAYILRPTDY